MVNKNVKEKDKSVLSLFIIMTLSLVLAAVGTIPSVTLKIFILILVFLLQAVIVKNILDDYYKQL